MNNAVARAAIRVFGSLTPGIAATWLEQQLMTPRRVPQLPLNPPAARGAVTQFPFEGTHLKLTEWGEGEGPTVLLIHGWGLATRSCWRLVDPLVGRGARVVALDLPAHGASGGRRTTMLHCAEAVRRVGIEVGPLHGVIAHSFAGPTAALAARNGLRIERLVMAAPLLSVHNALRQTARDIGLPAAVFDRMARGFSERLRFEWAELATDFLVSRFDAPVLVVHDEEDRLTPWTQGAAVARAAPRGELLTTAGLGHRAVLADRRAVEQMVDFVTAARDAHVAQGRPRAQRV